MNNASLYSADRATYLRVVVLGLLASTIFLALMIGLTQRVKGPSIRSAKQIQGWTIQASTSQYRACDEFGTNIVTGESRQFAPGVDNAGDAPCSKLARLD